MRKRREGARRGPGAPTERREEGKAKPVVHEGLVPGPPAPTRPALVVERGSTGETLGQRTCRADALRAVNEAGIPYVVAGAYAMREYAGIVRDTKDLDLFVRRRDVPGVLRALENAGLRTEVVDPVWLAKGFARDGEYVDVIFSSGNGVANVDDAWITRSTTAEVLGVPSRIAPPEEIIWSKAFVMERERFDGADVNHLLRFCAHIMDWEHLYGRFASHPEVLLSHLLLFRFSFPGDRHKIPGWLLERLFERCRAEATADEEPLCRGTLLSRCQYDVDLTLGLVDAREAEVEAWREHRIELL